MTHDPRSPMDLGGMLSGLLEQAQQMQERMAVAHEEQEARVHEGQAGGGRVKVRVSGSLEVQRVQIQPSCVDPRDVALLEDLIAAAVNDALRQVRTARVDPTREMAATLQGTGVDDLLAGLSGMPGPGGAGLPDLAALTGGLLGGPAAPGGKKGR